MVNDHYKQIELNLLHKYICLQKYTRFFLTIQNTRFVKSILQMTWMKLEIKVHFVQHFGLINVFKVKHLKKNDMETKVH